jgi:hypothetical protein
MVPPSFRSLLVLVVLEALRTRRLFFVVLGGMRQGPPPGTATCFTVRARQPFAPCSTRSHCKSSRATANIMRSSS